MLFLQERNIDVREILIGCLPLTPRQGIICTRARDRSHNPGMCSEWESHMQPFGYGTVLQPIEPHQLACTFVFFKEHILEFFPPWYTQSGLILVKCCIEFIVWMCHILLDQFQFDI